MGVHIVHLSPLSESVISVQRELIDQTCHFSRHTKNILPFIFKYKNQDLDPPSVEV